MTTDELLATKKVGPAEAAQYLQNGTTAHQIRIWAQHGSCPFCQAIAMRPDTQRLTYRVHIGNLIAFKAGHKTTKMENVPYGTVVSKRRREAT